MKFRRNPAMKHTYYMGMRDWKIVNMFTMGLIITRSPAI
jgi:hypothetical protein